MNRHGRQKGYPCKGEGGHWKRCPALNKGNLGCSDHMNDQGLTPHGFNKPAGLKDCNIHGHHLGIGELVKQESICKHRRDDKIHQQVGGNVKDGAGWPNPQHEF